MELPSSTYPPRTLRQAAEEPKKFSRSDGPTRVPFTEILRDGFSGSPFFGSKSGHRVSAAQRAGVSARSISSTGKAEPRVCCSPYPFVMIC